MSLLIPAGLAAGTALSGAAALYSLIRHRQMHLWLPQYLAPAEPMPPVTWENKRLDVFIAVCDHYEPQQGRGASPEALAKVERWHQEYPRLFERYRDSDGRTPCHTCFFPEEEYLPEYMDLLADLTERGFADVDIHLHHDHDTPEGLHHKLDSFRHTLHNRHGLLRRDPVTGEVVYGFIHGNWALNNCRPDGRWCGVDHEIPILLQTGCYADFTLPSAPSDTQTRTINSIYYAQDCPGQRKSHDTGRLARVGQVPPADNLLMIQGPLGLDWKNRSKGLLPRIENGDLTDRRPPTLQRMLNWLRTGVRVAGRPDWVFVKLHTHGCKDGNIEMWLSDKVQKFHSDLAQFARDNSEFRYHYVSAWEMAQLVHQAEQGAKVPGLKSLYQPTLSCH